MKVEVRHDDDCGNGYNTFTITSEVRNQFRMISCGCQHEKVAEHFPELASFIRWHLVGTNGPLHYIANTVYHAKNGDLEYARSSAVWPDATLEQLQDANALQARLPELLTEFQHAVEFLRFVY